MDHPRRHRRYGRRRDGPALRAVDRQGCWLESEHAIGRAGTCALRLPTSYTSAQHAVVRWAADAWEVKDLGSRNGTFVDGVRLRPGEDVRLHVGMAIAFGHPEAVWSLFDVLDPANVIERRQGTGTLRLGTEHIEIVTV